MSNTFDEPKQLGDDFEPLELKEGWEEEIMHCVFLTSKQIDIFLRISKAMRKIKYGNLNNKNCTLELICKYREHNNTILSTMTKVYSYILNLENKEK